MKEYLHCTNRDSFRNAKCPRCSGKIDWVKIARKTEIGQKLICPHCLQSIGQG